MLPATTATTTTTTTMKPAKVNATARDVVNTYMRDGPSLEKLSNMTMDECVAWLRDPKLIDASASCFKTITAICMLHHRQSVDSSAHTQSITVPTHMTTREFVVAYMMQTHSHRVFEEFDEMKNELLLKANTMIRCFGEICKAVKESPTPFNLYNINHKLTEDFITHCLLYVQTFKLWQLPDREKLCNRLKNALEMLYRSRMLLPRDGDDNIIPSALATRLANKIDELRAKFTTIHKKEALESFDKEILPTITAPSTQSVESFTTVPIAVDVTVDAETRYRITNEYIAHELLLDPGFRFSTDSDSVSSSPLNKQIKLLFNEFYWKSVKDDMELDKPCYAKVFQFISEFQTKLVHYAPPTQVPQITALLNLHHIHQKISQRSFSWPDCQHLITNATAAVELAFGRVDDNPDRAQLNEAISKMSLVANTCDQPAAFTDAMRLVQEYMNTIHTKKINARLASVAPVIGRYGIGYEKHGFKAKLAAGTVTLNNTTAWLTTAIAQGTTSNTIKVSTQPPKRFFTSYRNISNAAVIHLITAKDTITAATCPETLELDLYRLLVFQTKIHNIATSCVMLVTIEDFMRKIGVVGTNQWMELVSEFFTEDTLESTATHLQNVNAICAKLREHCIPSDPLAMTLKSAIRRNIVPDSAVYTIVMRRVSSLWLNLLNLQTASVNPSPIPPPGNAVYAQVPLIVVERVARNAAKLAHVVRVNYAVYGEWYHQIIESVEVKL